MDGLSVLAGATAAAEAATTRVTQRIVVPGRRPPQTSAAPPSPPPTPPNIPHRTQVVRVPHGAAPGDRCEYRLPEGTVADRAELKTAARRRRAPRSSLGTRAHRSTTAPQVARHFVVPAGAQVGDLLEVSDGTARLSDARGPSASSRASSRAGTGASAATPRATLAALSTSQTARATRRAAAFPERAPPPPPPWSPAADPPWAQAPPPPPPPPQNDFAWPLGPWQG